jgi:hypothetical protein
MKAIYLVIDNEQTIIQERETKRSSTCDSNPSTDRFRATENIFIFDFKQSADRLNDFDIILRDVIDEAIFKK